MKTIYLTFLFSLVALAQFQPPQVNNVLVDPGGLCTSPGVPLQYNITNGHLSGCQGASPGPYSYAVISGGAAISVPAPGVQVGALANGMTATTQSPGDNTTKLATDAFVLANSSTSSLISTSGPVADPGGPAVFQYNNAAGALTFNAPAGTATPLQRCYRNATGKSGAITIQMAASNTVDVGGTNGSSGGTLVSTGAAGDEACIRSDATNHFYATIISGSWTNN